MIMRIDFVGYEFQQDKCKKVYVNDLVIVVEKLVEVGGERKWERQYYDFLCSDISSGKNDFHYVKAALKWMVEHDLFGEVKQIILFSDNAGKHFKNCNTVEYLMYLAVSLQLRFLWIMYAPNHGWGLCDSHGGILSQMVYKADLNDNLPDTATKMQQLIQNSNFTNTNATVSTFQAHLTKIFELD